MIPRRRSSRLRNATPLKLSAHIAAQLESVTEFHEASMQETQTNSQNLSPVPKTPVTAGRIRPAPEEMHPSKAHQSTTQEPDSGLRLGFTDIKAEGSNQPSGITQKTPSKVNVARSSFDFRCARPGLQLGPEAQRIMDELNEEALRIKASLAAEREEKKRIASDENFKTHKQTKSKHKTGRFSDAHKAEFRKMDSIAGHPSAFRAQLSRTAPAKNSLKRSPSEAHLDTGNSDEIIHDRNGDNLYKSDRHQINQPTKIARKHITDDISSASRNSQISSTLDIPSSRSKLHSAIDIPTQASLSRVRVKKFMTRGPTSSKSQQKTSFCNPLSPSSKSAIIGDPSKPDRVRFPISSLEATTESITLPNISTCKSKNDLRKVFSLSSSHTGIGNSNKSKNVNFTPKTINKHAAAAQNSPSPVKSSIPRSISKPNLNVDSLSASNSKAPETSRNVDCSSLSNLQSPHRILCQDNPSSSIPSSFTFRSDQTIKFGPSPNRPRSTSIKNSNSQLLKDNGSHLSAYSFSSNHKQKEATNPLSPSGVSNKRRKRLDADDEHNLTERSPKKLKHQDTKSTIPRLKVMQGSFQKIQSPQKKSGVLSLSRLNILSRPKIRR